MYGIRVILENKNNVKSRGPLLKFIHIFYIFIKNRSSKRDFWKVKGVMAAQAPSPPPFPLPLFEIIHVL